MIASIESKGKEIQMASCSPRQEANRTILNLLSEAVEKNPDLRFHQLLQSLGIEIPHTDQFYEESSKTLESLVAMMSKS